MNADTALLWTVAIGALLAADAVLVALAIAVHRRWRAARARTEAAAGDGAALLGELQAIAVAQTAVQTALDGSQAATDALRQEVRALSAALGVFGQRLSRIEEGLERRADAAQPAGVRSELERKSIEFATRLAGRGASAEELIELCGLSRGEADLLLRVHARPGTASGQGGAGR